MTNHKKSPGSDARASRKVPQKTNADVTHGIDESLLQEFPLLPSARFAAKCGAIRRATDRSQSLRAVADFVHANMFVRHCGGTYGDLTRDAVANEAWTYVRLSPASGQVSAIEFATVVARMDELVREKYAP